MSPHQNLGLPNYEVHPEFGYLWPSHQLRQNVRVGLAAAAFGLITGLAGAMALFPRHSASAALTTPVLAAAPAGPTSELAPLPVSGPSIVRDKQVAPATPLTRSAGAGNDPSAAVQVPAAPAVPAVRSMTTVEHVRTETSKKARRAKANARPRAREPSPTEALAASPFSFETRRFSDGARPTWRRDRGSSWFW
jgi:hypothetical protein